MSGRSAIQVVQLTPPGRGAIATLLVEGPGAFELLGSLFFPNSGRPLGCWRTDQLVVGRFGREPGEEVVVCRCSDESVELHCHGGHAAVAMIQEALVERGGQVVAWQDCVVGHSREPIAAAAHVALAEAHTERTAAILLDQYHGALRRALEEIEEAVGRGEVLSASRQIDALLARAEVGRHLTRPWQVVLVGRPNVGKSSLINALVGYPRAIVHHTRGTTRDVVSATTAVDGWPVEISDTAGLSLPDRAQEGPAGGPLEGESCEGADLDQSEEALQRADIGWTRERLAAAELVVLVFDASEPWSAADGALIGAWPGGLVVHNKSDLPRPPGRRPSGLWTSALTGDGVEALGQALADGLVPEPPPPGAAVPFTSTQREYLAGHRLRARGEEEASSCPKRGRR